MKITQLDALFKNTPTTSTNPSTEEAYASFSAALEEAKKNGNAKEAYEAYMNGPDHPFKNIAHLPNGMTFPPADAPAEFRLAWDKTLNELPAVQRVLLTHDVLNALEFGDYNGPILPNDERAAIMKNRLAELGYKGLLELTKTSLKHAIQDNIQAGNDFRYINTMRDSLYNCQLMIDALSKFENKKTEETV